MNAAPVAARGPPDWVAPPAGRPTHPWFGGAQRQVPSVGPCELARDVEAQARALGGGQGSARIALEEAFSIRLGDARASIRDVDAQRSRAGRGHRSRQASSTVTVIGAPPPS